MSNAHSSQKSFYEITNSTTTSPQHDSTLQVAKPNAYIDPSSEDDWEIINPSDYETPKLGRCGVSASGSLKIGFGENKREVFSFNIHTNCANCREKRRKDDDEKTVVEDEKLENKTETKPALKEKE